MNYPASITSLFGDVVTKCSEYVLSDLQDANPAIEQINYLFGPVKELMETLANMQVGQTEINKMFPLVWLVEDITQDRRSQGGFYGSVNLRVVIAFPTSATYLSAQRESLVFDPILRPIYWNLLKAISVSRAFYGPDEFEGINHRMTERKYWGNDPKTEGALTTFVDAIDIEDLELRIDYQNCFTPILNN
jgi:hypothetical protein